MQSLGLSVAMPTSGRPVVRAVLAEDAFGAAQKPSLGDIQIIDEFDLTTAETDWARIASQLGQDVSARVSGLSPQIIIVRNADFHQSRRASAGSSLRLIVEGSITAAAMSHVANVHLRPGMQCATLYGGSKDAMDADARSLVSRAYRTEAAAAALSGLLGNRA